MLDEVIVEEELSKLLVSSMREGSGSEGESSNGIVIGFCIEGGVEFWVSGDKDIPSFFWVIDEPLHGVF